MCYIFKQVLPGYAFKEVSYERLSFTQCRNVIVVVSYVPQYSAIMYHAHPQCSIIPQLCSHPFFLYSMQNHPLFTEQLPTARPCELRAISDYSIKDRMNWNRPFTRTFMQSSYISDYFFTELCYLENYSNQGQDYNTGGKGFHNSPYKRNIFEEYVWEILWKLGKF